jgi:ribosomal protein S18 acetylase RimI-like enzyme
MAVLNIFRRHAEAADRPFLLNLYASTRADDLALLPWPTDQKEAFISMQFSAQSGHYAREYPNATYEVIEVGGEPAGQITIDRSTKEIHLLDIIFVPAFRGLGLGSRIISELLVEASNSGKSVGLYVENFNPAKRLYARLGFQEVSSDEIRTKMEWRALPSGPF